MPKEEPAAQVRIVLRPYASALPLGCFSFAIGNALLSAFLLHWIPENEARLLAVMLLVFVAPLELIACAMAFLSRDTGAATAMGIFAAAWVVQGVQFMLFGAALSAASGILLALLAVCLGMLTAITFSGKPLIGILLVAATLRSAGAAGMQFGGGKLFTIVAAGFGFVVTLAAFYCGFALLVEDVQGSLHPLTGRTGAARDAMSGGLESQMGHIENEAGVRQQL